MKSTGDNTYAVTLLGGSEGSEETIEAFYTDTLPGGRTKQIVIGALRVRAYAPAQRRVVPVILNRASLGVSPTALQETLNGIYQQAAVSWTVGEPISLTVNQSEWDTDERDGALLVETSPFNRYSGEMQAIIDRVKDLPTYDPEANYLIVTDLPNSMGYAGYMPLKSDFAFIFTQNDNEAYRIMAHELGHGAFYLKHPQDEYRILEGTDNLMDKYAVGKTLWKPQWDWIGDPSWRLYAFQEESDGAFSIEIHKEILSEAMDKVGGFKITPPLDFISEMLLDGVQSADMLGFALDFHFDNKYNNDSIVNEWIKLNRAFKKNSDLSAQRNGWLLHELMDFYAHSNFIELYIEYWINTGKNINDLTLDNFPTYEVAIGEFKFNNDYAPRLKSGHFDLIKWINRTIVPFWENVDYIYADENGYTHHDKMNKDEPGKGRSDEYLFKSKNTLHQYARSAALHAAIKKLLEIK